MNKNYDCYADAITNEAIFAIDIKGILTDTVYFKWI